MVEILEPDKYCRHWRVLCCGDEIIVKDKAEAINLSQDLEKQGY